MKYTLYINQPKAIELGITNIQQAHVFDLLTTASTWASVEKMDDGYYYWVSRELICRQMPLLKIKPDTAYRHLRFLAEIGLIDHLIIKKRDYIKITKKGKEYLIKQGFNENSDLNPSFLEGSKQPKVNAEKDIVSKTGLKKLGFKSAKNSDLNPTYKTIKEHEFKKKKIKKKESYESQCDNFVFSDELNKKIIKRFQSITPEQMIYLRETFQSMAVNRATPFKNLNMGFINYLNQGYLDTVISTNSPAKGTVEAFEQDGVSVNLYRINQMRSDNPNITDAEIEALLNEPEMERVC